MHYELPIEEDVTEIRIELRRAYLERDAGAYRRWALNEYVEGRRSLESIGADQIAAEFETRMSAVVKRATEQSWYSIRLEVWKRDGAICHVCGASVLWRHYECGHVVDRVCGGSDRPSNLVVMCNACNRMKPLHETRAQYIAWLDAGDWRAAIATKPVK